MNATVFDNIYVMPCADQPTRRNQMDINNERFVGWPQTYDGYSALHTQN